MGGPSEEDTAWVLCCQDKARRLRSIQKGRRQPSVSIKSVFRQVHMLGRKIPLLDCRFISGRLWENPVSKAYPRGEGWVVWMA